MTDLPQERTIHTLAEFSIKLFRLEVPQHIGTLRCLDDGTQEVIPMRSASQVYDTLEDFVDSLFQRKLQSDSIGTDEELRHRSEQVLARLASEVALILKRLAGPAHRRCVLTHDDLHPTNILVGDDGALTGVIDWECQSVLPAVLAVTYPPFLQYELDDDDTTTSWSVSPEDAAELRKLFAHVSFFNAI